MTVRIVVDFKLGCADKRWGKLLEDEQIYHSSADDLQMALLNRKECWHR